jgi:hypothetical protein
MRLTIVGLSLCLGASIVAARSLTLRADREPELRVSLDSEHRATITLTGRRAHGDAECVLSFYVGTSMGENIPPVAGTYELSDSATVFRPYFALVPGVEYTAVAGSLTTRVFIPDEPAVPRGVVSAVYPTADTLPANLLKFYIHFSHQMRDGDAAQHVALLDSEGRVLSRAFLASDVELWDRAHRRLTILLDPGRIKRGLAPNQQYGPPLVAGRRYTLRIDPTWRDADGGPLIAGYEKSFIASAPTRTPLTVDDWRTHAPKAGTTDPIELQLPRPIDHALAERLVRVEGPEGPVVVTSVTANAERTIRIVPRAPWSAGAYRVLIGAEIEDLAGNSLQRLFDVDLADPAARTHDELIAEKLPIRIDRR